MIELKNLTKKFDELTVLNDISIKIEKGDIYGVIGLSGEGKSTLVRCINLLEQPDNGEILYTTYSSDGSVESTVNVESLKGENLRNYRKSVSMIFQDFNLLNQKTVFENVEFPLTLEKGYKRTEEVKKHINSLLSYVGLEEKTSSYPSQLSGGQKQRVAIARSLVNNPKVLLCDEATSALDPTTAASILDLLLKLNKELNISIIIIAHQMSVIERICNKVAILSDHKIVEQGPMHEVFLNPKTEAAKSLIYSDHVRTVLQDSHLLKLEFNGDTDSPVIANIIQECNILVSIVYANSFVVDGKIYGQLIMKLPYYDEDIDKLKTYLNIKGINYKEVSAGELDKSITSN